MKISLENLLYATRHPAQTLRYLKYRDVIPCSEIARHLPSDPVILEAGAANGINTLEMGTYWPRATLHAFEPVPTAREALTSRIRGCEDRAHIYPLALGDKPGTFEMHLSGEGNPNDSQSSSLLKPTGHSKEYSFVSFQSTISVDVVTMDQWALDNRIERIDFLWLDMQGYELRALRGATRILQTVRAIHMEVANISLYDGAPLYPEVRRQMKSFGFRIAREAIFRIGGNVLFVRVP